MVEEPKGPKPRTIKIEVSGLLAILLVLAFGLIALAVVVGLLRNSLNITAVVSVLATTFGGILAGYLASNRTPPPGGDDGDA